jgi:signal transduction histidine kinase
MFEILRNTYKEISMPVPGGQERSNRMLNKPDILAGVSHEVRTLMNAIVAFSYLINNKQFTDEERKEFSEQIIQSCEQLSGLFDNFLDSAVLETGKVKHEMQECDATKNIENLASEFRILMRKKNKDNITFIQEDNLPGKLMVEMDVPRISRVIHNLFRNALDNTDSGYIRLGCTFRENIITFYIKDTGKGYAQNRDFLLSDNPEIFFSENQDTYSAMNLILARNLITAMGGSIRVEPNEVEGTSVFFTLHAKECSGFKILAGDNADTRIAI